MSAMPLASDFLDHFPSPSSPKIVQWLALLNLLGLEDDPHQDFNNETGQLIEGGVKVVFSDRPPFLDAWTGESVEGQNWTYQGAVLGINDRGIIFAADPDPMNDDWKTFNPNWRQVLVLWTNIVSIEAKHTS